MSKRLLLLFVLVFTIGLVTRAFAEDIRPPLPVNQSITRADAISLIVSSNPIMLNRAHWFASHMPPLPLFSDVDQRQWYTPYLEAAFEQGIVTGNEDRTFRPNDALNQQDAISLMTRYKRATDPSAGVYLVVPGTDTHSLNHVVSEAVSLDLRLPFPVRPDTAIQTQEVLTMLESAGVNQPASIVVAVIPLTTPLPAVALQPILSNSLVASTSTDSLAQQIVTNTVDPSASGKRFAITMPTLDITDLMITHPTSFSHDGLLAPLKNGVGHLFSYPGQGGKILIYGHSSSYPWDVSQFTKIFRKINKLAVGDKVYVTYNDMLYTYQVTFKQAVNANDTSAYAQEGKEELILYTCWPPDSIKQRYLVHASLVSTEAVK